MAHSWCANYPAIREAVSSKETMIINSLKLNIYSTLSKTHQILFRFRPIAPNSQASTVHASSSSTPIEQHVNTSQSSAPSSFLPKQPLPPHAVKSFQGCRKRTKAKFSLCTPKRLRIPLSDLPYSSPRATSSSLLLASPAGNALPSRSMLQSFAGELSRLTISSADIEKPNSASANPFTILPPPHILPQLPLAVHRPDLYQHQTTTTTTRKFWTSALLHPEFLRRTTCCSKVITPQPVRPIGPSISVGCISEDPTSSSCAIRALKRPEEVEEEVESEALPAIISDSNRVRLANSAYMEMIGQPECSWLDATYDARPRSCACKRINGEAMLQLPQTGVSPVSNGFTCRIRIKWGSDGKKSFIYAPCDVIRLSCISKDPSLGDSTPEKLLKTEA